jgi:hypothetical protein
MHGTSLLGWSVSDLELVLGDVFRFCGQEGLMLGGASRSLRAPNHASNTDCPKIVGPEETPACPLHTEENFILST